MTTGVAELDRMIATCRAVGGLAERAAPDVADAIRAELERNIAAGVTPDEEPWQLTRDGRVPLRNAATKLYCGAVGTTIYVRLIGPEARHHLGRARGRIVRQVLPTSSRIPTTMAATVRDVLARHFVEITRGDA